MLDATALAHLGVRVHVVPAIRPAPPSDLTPGERAQLDRLATATRRHDWLLGRAALKALPGAEVDTSGLVFPHPHFSLTHAGGTAVAVRAEAGTVAGVGVDLEPWDRRVSPATARFFLTPAEAAPAAGDGLALLRLWTVKEALFKATPDNGDAVLVGYRLDDPGARLGTARGARGEQFRYAGVDLPAGALTVAVCVRDDARKGCDAAVR